MPSFTVRRAELSDLNSGASLFDLYRQFYKRTPDLAGARAYINMRLTKQDSVIFLALADDNTTAGFLQLYPGFSSLSMAPTWVLNDLYVSENYRGNKIATQLIEAAHAYARSTGAVSISLETQPDNKKAQALYEKFGYEVDNDFLIYVLSLKK